MRSGFAVVAILIFNPVLNGQNPQSDLSTSKSRLSGCVPVSILHTLSLGRDEYKRIFCQLPGSSPEEKCEYIATRYGAIESGQFPGRSVVRQDGGVVNEDLDDLFNALLADHGEKQVKSVYLNKLFGESDHEHLTRVQKILSTSLSRGVPPIIAFRSVGPVRDSDGKYRSWHDIAAHAVTVVDVAKDFSDYQEGFSFDYLEGIIAERKQGYAYMEKYRNFPVRISTDSDAPKDKHFLNAVVPSMSLGTYKLKWNERGVIIMMVAVGDFEPEK